MSLGRVCRVPALCRHVVKVLKTAPGMQTFWRRRLDFQRSRCRCEGSPCHSISLTSGRRCPSNGSFNCTLASSSQKLRRVSEVPEVNLDWIYLSERRQLVLLFLRKKEL